MRRRMLLISAVALAAGGVVLLAVVRTDDGSQPARSTARQATRTAPRPKPRPQRIRGRHDRPVPILMYHVIGSRPAGAPFPELYVSRKDFARQLRWLASHRYDAVTLHDVHEYWHGLLALPRKPIVLTFDDGYRGHFTNAGPLLRARSWPGVLNLEVAHVVHGDLTPRMIRRLLTDGWELASHTLTHPDLTVLDSRRLKREVAGSRRWLRRRFGVDVDFFSYPAGRYNRGVIAAVRASGYLGATTTVPGLARRASPFRLSRIRIDGSDGVRGLAEKLARAG
jgi:peptidoglycan/xylan/chitin deacetylase (PgdA/CDA1 family)